MIVKTQRGSADVMNEGFHEGLDSGQMYQNWINMNTTLQKYMKSTLQQ